MKKTLFLLLNLLIISELSTAQSVTLATSIPVSPTKGTVVYNNGTNELQYWNGSAWIPITNAASGTGWALNGTDIYNSNSGRVLIGASSLSSAFKLNVVTPASNFGILHAGTNGINIGSYVGSANGFFGTTSNHPLILMANFGSQLTLLPSGYIGVGNTTNPTNKLQVGSVGSTGYVGNDIAIGNGTNATAFYQSNSTMQIGTTQDLAILTRQNSGGGGYVGINTATPANKLQIGSVGGTGYAGNDLAIGNGTNAFGIYQTNTETRLASTTNITLTSINGNGRVGINTLTPRAPLDVATTINASPLSAYTSLILQDAYKPLVGIMQNTTPVDVPNVSILASGNVYATAFNAYSDSRIKNIIGISNSANDLETIKALQITDYTMKDKIQNGNKIYKKVIAQQVEKVYPQAVSQTKDVVPDIYTLAEKAVFDEVNKNLICSLSKSYDIKIGEKIEFVHEKEGKIKAEVIEVSGNSFTVKDWQYPTDKIFVYGREVNDFRTVDYEAISMLGISAIQQLAKEVEELKNQNSKLKADFSARLEAIETLLVKSQTGK